MNRRIPLAAALAALVPLLPAAPALAHGAPTTPISRTAACAAGGGTATGTAACKAARAANGGPFGTFDNLRVANVNGDDRKFVPDGKLCSGGLDAFKGLDLAREDFPSTKVEGGESLAIRYRATLPHEGSFRIYLTKVGYDQEEKLTWDDLGSKPLAEVTDPPLREGSYRMSVKLPSRSGRHILYIVWQTSSTADTYYSCSDLVFQKAAAAPVATKKPSKSPSARPSTSGPAEPAAEPTTTEPVAASQARDITPVGDSSRVTLGHQIIAGAIIVGAGFLAYAVIGGFLRRRRENR